MKKCKNITFCHFFAFGGPCDVQKWVKVYKVYVSWKPCLYSLRRHQKKWFLSIWGRTRCNRSAQGLKMANCTSFKILTHIVFRLTAFAVEILRSKLNILNVLRRFWSDIFAPLWNTCRPIWNMHLIYCRPIHGYFRGGFIFANFANFASETSQKCPLQFMSIYSTEKHHKNCEIKPLRISAPSPKPCAFLHAIIISVFDKV